MLFGHLLFQKNNNFFYNIFQEIYQCKTVWIQIKPDILAGLS